MLAEKNASLTIFMSEHQAGLKLPTSSDPPTLAYQSAEYRREPLHQASNYY